MEVEPRMVALWGGLGSEAGGPHMAGAYHGISGEGGGKAEDGR